MDQGTFFFLVFFGFDVFKCEENVHATVSPEDLRSYSQEIELTVAQLFSLLWFVGAKMSLKPPAFHAEPTFRYKSPVPYQYFRCSYPCLRRSQPERSYPYPAVG